MAEGTASLLEFYAKGNSGGAVSVEQRVAQAWRAACPGDEQVMHGVQHIGMVAGPEAFGGSMAQKVGDMDAAAKEYAAECIKEHPDALVAKQRYDALVEKMGDTGHASAAGRRESQKAEN